MSFFVSLIVKLQIRFKMCGLYFHVYMRDKQTNQRKEEEEKKRSYNKILVITC